MGYMHHGFLFGPNLWYSPFDGLFMLVVVALGAYCLWHAAKRNEIWWFIALFLVFRWGIVGFILELVYLVVVLKKHKDIQAYMNKHDHEGHHHDHAHHDHHHHDHPHTPPTPPATS